MATLTRKQSEILEYLHTAITVRGMPPTLEELRQVLGVSSANGVREHLHALERKGVIELVPGIARGIRLKQSPKTKKGAVSPREKNIEHNAEMDTRSTVSLPVIGRVAAGVPILAAPHIESQCKLDAALFRPRPDFLLRVIGTSMKDIGICDGDLLAIHKTDQANEGQIVVARVNDEVTVKRFYRGTGSIAWLRPENPDFESIKVDLKRDELTIEGVVVGVVRKL